MNAAWIVLTWGPYLVPGAGFPARSSGPFNYMVDADVCLSPTRGLFEPRGFAPYTAVLREILLAGVWVSKQSCRWSCNLRSTSRTRCGSNERARPTRQRRGPSSCAASARRSTCGAEMMEEMRRQQGSVMHLGDAEQQRALVKVSRASDVSDRRGVRRPRESPGRRVVRRSGPTPARERSSRGVRRSPAVPGEGGRHHLRLLAWTAAAEAPTRRNQTVSSASSWPSRRLSPGTSRPACPACACPRRGLGRTATVDPLDGGPRSVAGLRSCEIADGSEEALAVLVVCGSHRSGGSSRSGE